MSSNERARCFITGTQQPLVTQREDAASPAARVRTLVDPVNATLSMPMCEAIAAPAVGPYPGKILTTPGGNPACQNNTRGNNLQQRLQQSQAKRRAVWGNPDPTQPTPPLLPAENGQKKISNQMS